MSNIKLHSRVHQCLNTLGGLVPHKKSAKYNEKRIQITSKTWLRKPLVLHASSSTTC